MDARELIATEAEDDKTRREEPSDGLPEQWRRPEAAVVRQTSWHWSRGARVDPFDCVTGEDLYKTSFYSDFLVHYVIPTVASINEAFNVVNVYGTWILENMAKYNDFFHILLGLIKVAYTALAKPGLPLPQEVFVHAGQAMSRLRSRLAKPNARADDGAILTVLFLAMFERGLGNNAAFKAHRWQVDKIVASRGGDERLGVNSPARATLTVLLSLSGERPSDPVREQLPQRPLLSRPDSDKDIRGLPIGFQNLVRTGALSNETSLIIRRINAKRDWSPHDANYRERQGDDQCKVFRPVSGQAWNFWDACTALRTPDGPDGPSLEKLICLALFRYCANRANRFRPKACIYHSATTHLTALLPLFTLPVTCTERDCLIWIWLMARFLVNFNQFRQALYGGNAASSTNACDSP